jgi:hypothetical protein
MNTNVGLAAEKRYAKRAILHANHAKMGRRKTEQAAKSVHPTFGLYFLGLVCHHQCV